MRDKIKDRDAVKAELRHSRTMESAAKRIKAYFGDDFQSVEIVFGKKDRAATVFLHSGEIIVTIAKAR